MNRYRTYVLALLLGAPLLAAPLAAQAGAAGAAAPQSPASGAPIGDIEVVSEREVFSYPAFRRRNPFRPLAGNEAGPRFEQVELRGIIYDRSDPARSVALLALRGAAQRQVEQQVQQQLRAQEAGTLVQQDTVYIPEPTERLRVGQRWGNVRVIEIREDHVVLDVTEFGITERRVLTIPVRRQGGP